VCQRERESRLMMKNGKKVSERVSRMIGNGIKVKESGEG
jgi:hypothetical protein